MADRVLYLIGCAAPPVRDLGTLVSLLHLRKFQVCVIVTPSAAEWIDLNELAGLTGQPVRSAPRHPDDSASLPKADAMLLCPATFNTLNKWTAGIADNFALGVLSEAIGLSLPICVAPYAKNALAAHPAFDESLAKLERWGVTVLANELVRPVSDGDQFLWGDLIKLLDERWLTK